MYYKDFQGKKLSALGFGLMRLPCLSDGSIDTETFERMVDIAMQEGVNYFDTAYPYHGGLSEVAAGKALGKYPRESYYLADKYPGHQIGDKESAALYDPEKVFSKQLEKCGVEYFDFYLLHNVNEFSAKFYMDESLGIVDYFLKQKEAGKIKHLGFSTHARLPQLKEFLDKYGEKMEFCQIQLNYMDWDLQDAKGKVALLNEWNIPVWVMEPVRGGKLADLPADDAAKLKALRPEASIASWALRYLQDIPGVTMILSGMSNEAQMLDNLKTFLQPDPTTAEEKALLYAIADKLGRLVPCTACRYCCDGCPMGLDIPVLINTYNQMMTMEMAFVPAIYIDTLPKEKWPHACVGCGACAQICPQNIDIPGVMKKVAEKLDGMPSWADICRERAEAAAKLEKQG